MPADAFGTNLDIAMADLTRAKTELLKSIRTAFS